jgi:hypothetical protein
MTEGHLLLGNKQNPQQEIRSKTHTCMHKLWEIFLETNIWIQQLQSHQNSATNWLFKVQKTGIYLVHAKKTHTQSPESLVNPQHQNLTISSNNMPTKRVGTTSWDSKGIDKSTPKKKELIIRKFMTELYLEHPSLSKLLWSFDFEKPGYRLALQKQD